VPLRAPASVVAADAVGPYTLLRLRRGRFDAGAPGQFFMLRPERCLLPRPMSVCLASRSELGFLVDPVGPGTRALAAAAPGERVVAFGPLGRGFDLRVGRPLLVGGGVGIAPLPLLSAALGAPPALLGFRTARHAEAASLVPNARVVRGPSLVTDAIEDGYDVLACGPEPMLETLRARWPGAQLAWEAPMACGYGACYGCAVPVGGRLRRLCVEGPVLRAA
jgi:dihydroorotate dehydrogenase electron transfer subunit